MPAKASSNSAASASPGAAASASATPRGRVGRGRVGGGGWVEKALVARRGRSGDGRGHAVDGRAHADHRRRHITHPPFSPAAEPPRHLGPVSRPGRLPARAAQASAQGWPAWEHRRTGAGSPPALTPHCTLCCLYHKVPRPAPYQSPSSPPTPPLSPSCRFRRQVGPYNDGRSRRAFCHQQRVGEVVARHPPIRHLGRHAVSDLQDEVKRCEVGVGAAGREGRLAHEPPPPALSPRTWRARTRAMAASTGQSRYQASSTMDTISFHGSSPEQTERNRETRVSPGPARGAAARHRSPRPPGTTVHTPLQPPALAQQEVVPFHENDSVPLSHRRAAGRRVARAVVERRRVK